MKGKPIKKGSSNPLTEAQAKEVAALADLPDDRIDTSDIPEQTDWSGARRGAFFRPAQRELTLRIDADLIEWFETHTDKGEGYETRINSALRSYVIQHERDFAHTASGVAKGR